jgi:amino acid adenylation domain-containing protein
MNFTSETQLGVATSPLVRLKTLDALVEIKKERADTPLCVHEFFEQQVEVTPGAVALTSRGASLTYHELNERANQLAHYLCEHGVGPESLVGVCLKRSFQMVIAMLAILKAGGAYVPLDPVYPPERLRFMLEDAGLALLLTNQDLLDRLPNHDTKVTCLDVDAGAIAEHSKDNPLSRVTEQNLAYMIYTSGSTGKPKGVLVQHCGVPNLAKAQASVFGVRPDSRVLQFASISFDASVSEVFKSLLAGAQLYVDSEDQLLTGPDLIRLLREQAITVVTLPPSVLSTLNAEELPALQTLVVAGEACPPDLVARWSRGRRFLNAYGPTEITVCATIAECDDAGGRPPIGRPMSNTQVYVLDSNLQNVATGEAGELYLGGAGIARGYHNRPELTAEKFIPNPFSDEPGSRLYRTGDWGCYRPDGQIEFLGRIDDQVKVRGFRIELAEIETTLSCHAGVKTCVVVAREDARGEKQLVAYVIGEGETAPESARLRNYLKERLPEYMVPAAFVMLENLPLSPNGKIDRLALPAPTRATPNAETGYEAPRTKLERLLAQLWREILFVEHIGRRDKFFEIGGDSLKAARFLNRLQEELGEVVYIVALFDAPTVAELASYLQDHYPQAVARLTGEEWLSHDRTVAPSITNATIDDIRRLIRPLSPPKFRLTPRNPPAIFILSPPRSGSTLLRVMLAGHKELFAPPELQMLCCNTLRDRKATFVDRYSFWLEGTMRALMDIMDCDAEMAKRMMEECEQQDMTTPEFYRLMQELVHPRKLVDKTPAYALDPETLKRAEDSFDGALYIHLLRHPYGMIRSFEDARLDQIFRYEHSLSPRELAECIWLICHQNICGFLGSVPAQRQHVVRFEELVKHPTQVLQELCGFLDIEFDEAMVQPHAKSERKMTDGIHGLSRMLGDIKFHTHKKVDENIADRWKQHHKDDFLSEMTCEWATALRYELDPKSKTESHSRVLSPIKLQPRRKQPA